MNLKKKKWIRFRAYLISLIFLIGLGTLVARAYQLQVLERDRLNAIARDGYICTIKLPSKRGTIYDRRGHELAISAEAGSVYSHPGLVKEKRKTARKLSRALNKNQGKILTLLRSKKSFVWIDRKIAPERASAVKALDLPGVGVTKETRRYHPGREIAAHLVGFVGTDNNGLEGLEKEYDKFLQGPQLTLIHMKDALGRPFSITKPVASGKKMHDLTLTIDKDIQYKAQQALKSAVKKTRARSGQCLVVDPDTGEILAMAVFPDFNPNIFSRYKPHQWRNRTVTDCFEPGSTIKAFLLAAGLEEGVVKATSSFDCEQGKYKVSGRVINDTHKYGVLTVSDIIVHSSNIGAIKIGQKLGYKKFRKYLLGFGFGKKTGVDILGERNGFVRPEKGSRPLDRANNFFGQGMTTTSLQMVMAMAAIANGGKLMRPYVVKKIQTASGDIVKKTNPRVVRRVISEKTAEKVAAILEGVVSEEGTGPQASISGFRVAGKTGTAQKVDQKTRQYSKKKYVASFVGFAPVSHPRLVIIVVVDEPKGIPYGGIVAGPVFGEVGQWTLNYLRVNPQIRLAHKGLRVSGGEKTTSEPRHKNPIPLTKVKGGLLPDFRGLGMREVLKKGRNLGLDVLLEGTGMAFKQHPRPGASLRGIKTVKISFRPPA